MTTLQMPVCSYCGREFRSGEHWQNANYCRAVFLAEAMGRLPDRTAWELHQATGMAYADVTKGLQKGRDLGIIAVSAEEQREQGGIRYRYVATTELAEAVERFKQRGYI